MNEISKLKTELSKLSGVDFHNPKYREVFKRYFDNKDGKVEEDEEPKVMDAKDEDTKADAEVTAKSEEIIEDIAENRSDDAEGEKPDYEKTDKDQEELKDAVNKNEEADDKVQDAEAEEETAEGEEEKTKPTEESKAEELSAEEKALREVIGEDEPKDLNASEVMDEETGEVQTEAETQPALDVNDQLVDKTLELELVKAGIREDRIEVAKRLFLPELKGGASIEEIREKIAQFPEWIGKKGGAQGFGMPLGDKSQALTNEERALKAMGINPRD